MVIVKLMGGLGNQMFQYAFGFYLSQKNKTKLKLDLNFLNDRSSEKKISFREFDLTLFNITETAIAETQEIELYTGISSENKRFDFKTRFKRKLLHPNHIIDYSLNFNNRHKNVSGNIYLEGYFQSLSYFNEIEDLVRNEFKFKQPILPVSTELLNKINSTDSVCLNVRRTDYMDENTSKNIQGFIGLEYYFNAVNILKEKLNNIHLFIFSDDMEWCKNNLNFDLPMHFILDEHNGEKYGNKFQLMTMCKHFIIPNSTFAWWAAWLSSNKDKIVIAPKKWLNDPNNNTKDIVPSTWIRL